jgi:outer membrane protein insertion porin family
LRGYENDITGDNMLLLSAEYRFPVVDKITGVVFTDNGNAWDESDQIALDDLNSSAGLGVMMNTPLGQIKLDYGWNEKGNGKFHFSLGNAF